jgi:hypothetical protein
MPVSLATLQKGHEFPPIEFDASPEWVGEYLAATADETSASAAPGLVPPMGVATLAIRALLQNAELPAGTLHASQEIRCDRAVSAGEHLAVSARVASRGERAGWVLMSVDLDVASAGEPVMTGRATVTFPADGAQA